MIYKHSTTTAYLKDELEKRVKLNSSFSLRAFARKLKLSPSALSMVINGKKKLSLERAMEVARHLELNPEEQQYLVTLVQLETTKSAELKQHYLLELQKLNPEALNSKEHTQTLLSLEHFKLLSDWYGLATLELVTHLSGPWSAQGIARRLSISHIEALNTLERLVKLELIQEVSPNHFVRLRDTVLVKSTNTSEALRKYYQQLHEKSLESLHQQTPEEKAIGSQVFAVDPAQLPEIRELTYRYLDDLAALASTGKERTEIYQSLVNVFRLTNRGDTHENNH